MKKVLVATEKPFSKVAVDGIKEITDAAGYELALLEKYTDKSQLLAAVADADASPDNLLARFSVAAGQTLSREQTPRTAFLLERTMNDAYQAIAKTKHHYRRIRPFVRFNEPSAIARDEASHRKSFSYPSAHAAMAWAVGLVTAELARAYQYGQSRVIVGYHYQSDVQAAQLAASAVVARLHADKAFRKAFRKARKELLRNYQKLNGHGAN